jgi:ABC-type polysaccharide/polyol phosphate transport system ATPase subunit
MTMAVVENVSLRKTLFDRATGGLVERGEGRHEGRYVVKSLTNVSFTLRDNDRLGLVGHNGAGKSTLLKVLAGVYEPVSGRVLVDGHITPLFNTLPGLDAEDTGYRNIVTAGLLLGMSRDEIEARIPEIEEFSELGEYLSLPVRTYSAGMTARLGFAVATTLDPGILLMDEGLGAGDARFAERMRARLDEFVNRSQIIVLATHSEALMRSMCNKAALLHNGYMLKLGEVDEVLAMYHDIVSGKLVPEMPPKAA